MLAPVPGGDEVRRGLSLDRGIQATKGWWHNTLRVGLYRDAYRISIGPAQKYYKAAKNKWLYPVHIHWDVKPLRLPFIERNWWK